MEPPARRRAFDLEILETEYSVRYLKKKKKREREKENWTRISQHGENGERIIMYLVDAGGKLPIRYQTRSPNDSRLSDVCTSNAVRHVNRVVSPARIIYAQVARHCV